jgi:serine/threonine-protein kinase
MSTFNPGATLGRYRIERLLGSGAMGEVYLAEDPQIGRRVALKTLRILGVRPEELPERRQRLLREARTAGRLIHPHVVTLFDAGEDGGFIYLAFEYVPGSDLGVRLGAGPPLTLGAALRLVREACSGLDHAHKSGIVHRDIKPSNLLLDADGRLKISDFGIAKMAGQATELTVSGSVMGSPHYLSPEQIRGEELDGRSDLFSLGVVLYELLARRRPFGGDTISTLVYQILQAEPPPLSGLRPDLPPRLHALVGRLLAKDRDDRPPTAAAVDAEVAAVVAELPAEVLDAPAAGAEAIAGATRLLESRDAPPVAAPEGAGSFATAPSPPPGALAASPPIPPPAASPGRTAGRRLALPIALGCGLLVVLAAAALLFTLSRQPLRPGEALRALGERAGLKTGGERVADASGAGDPDAEALEAGGRPAEASGSGEGAEVEAGESAAGEPIEPIDWEIEETGDDADAAVAGRGAGAGASGGQAGPREAGDAATGAGAGRVEAGGARAGAGSSPGAATGSGRDAAGGVSVSEPGGRGDGAAGATSSGTPPGTSGAGPSSTASAPSDAAAPPPPARDPAPPPDTGLTSGLGLAFRVIPDDAFVLIDGTVIGRAREWRPGERVYQLPGAGSYDVTLRKGGMRDRRIRVAAAADGPAVTAVAARLEPLPMDEVEAGDLEVHRVREAVAFNVDVPGAQVLVDGRRVGPATRFSGGLGPRRWLELPRGLHRVTILAPGRQRVDLAIEITPGAVERRKRITVVLPAEGRR